MTRLFTRRAWSGSAHHDDHARRADGRAADCAGFRCRRLLASTARAGRRRWTGGVPVHHAVRHPGHLSLSRRIPEERAGPHELLPVGPLGAGERRGSAGLRPFRLGQIALVALMAAAAIAASGCIAGPEYVRPLVQAPPAY